MARSQERFRREKSLGSGAFGVVYLAYDTRLERQVALKLPHDDEKERALLEEARLMAQIQALHEPHVVSLYDLHEVNGHYAIAMEYVAGRNLRAHVGKIEEHPHPPLDVEWVLHVGLQICAGLQTLHNAFGDAGIFHRDIKPENILIRDADGLVKIADFGIARVLEASGAGSTTIGTPPYMSPELLGATERGADYRADVYGVGVTLYEMLTGRLPFNPLDGHGRAKPPLQYYREICNGHPPAPAAIAGLDEALSDLVLQAIHWDVDQRYQSVQTLHEALETFQARFLFDRERSGVDDALAAAGQERDPTIRERLLRSILQRFPRHPQGYCHLAWLYSKQARFSEAVHILEEGRLHCPPSGELLMDLAIGYAQLGHVQRAIDTLQAAQKLDLPAKKQQGAMRLLHTWRRRG
jgi:serine/threonine-protein kinase